MSTGHVCLSLEGITIFFLHSLHPSLFLSERWKEANICNAKYFANIILFNPPNSNPEAQKADEFDPGCPARKHQMQSSPCCIFSYMVPHVHQ